MRLFIVVVSLLIGSLSYAHCPINLAPTNLCADIDWVDGPYFGKLSAFRVQFWEKGDSSHNLVEPDAQVEFMSYMYMDNGHHHSGPGMTWTKLADGLYEVKDARFMDMPGYWVIFVKLLDENKALIAKDSQKVPIERSGDGHDHEHRH